MLGLRPGCGVREKPHLRVSNSSADQDTTSLPVPEPRSTERKVSRTPTPCKLKAMALTSGPAETASTRDSEQVSVALEGSSNVKPLLDWFSSGGGPSLQSVSIVEAIAQDLLQVLGHTGTYGLLFKLASYMLTRAQMIAEMDEQLTQLVDLTKELLDLIDRAKRAGMREDHDLFKKQATNAFICSASVLKKLAKRYNKVSGASWRKKAWNGVKKVLRISSDQVLLGRCITKLQDLRESFQTIVAVTTLEKLDEQGKSSAPSPSWQQQNPSVYSVSCQEQKSKKSKRADRADSREEEGKKHPHPLQPIQYNYRYFCKLCNKAGKGWAFRCLSCREFEVHPECVPLSQEVSSSVHKGHPLVHTSDHPYKDKAGYSCNVCNKGGEGQVFRCNLCNFDVHPSCLQL